MAQYPRPSKTDMSNPLVGFTAEQPAVHVNGTPEVRSGQSLLNANGVGKLNENRFTSLKPSRNDK